MPPLLSDLLRGGEFLTYIVVAFYVVRRINRDETLKKDYPPHRHINGKIAYPEDYPPAKVESLQPL